MRKLGIMLTTAAAFAIAAPAASMAQGFSVDTPVGGVRVGEPGYRHHYRDRDHDPRFRDRSVYLRGDSDCRTVTIQRDDGSIKRIRRCD
jgi:hypothetical protein